MALAFKILADGEDGKIYKISPGLTVGRRAADLKLEDKKVSGLHAMVVESEDKLHLVDQNSRNGLIVDKLKVESCPLDPGVQILIGKTTVEVVELDDDDPLIADPMETWKTILTKFNEKLIREAEFEPRYVGPLEPALQLSFIQGRQLETDYVLGYGPRALGFSSKEFPIFEPNMPEVCFEVYPNEGAWFKTDHPDKVRLNNEEVTAQGLRSGDRIYIGESIIEVSFIHG